MKEQSMDEDEDDGPDRRLEEASRDAILDAVWRVAADLADMADQGIPLETQVRLELIGRMVENVLSLNEEGVRRFAMAVVAVPVVRRLAFATLNSPPTASVFVRGPRRGLPVPRSGGTTPA